MTVAISLAAAFLTFACGMHLTSIAMAGFRSWWARRRPRRPTATPPVTVLRPVCGLDYAVEATLRSTFLLDWPDYEIVFCCASATDPVIPLVESLIAEHPHVPARLLTGDDRISINPKLNNLVKGWSDARHEWVVMADSNVLLPPGYISNLMGRWTPDTGLVVSPPIGGQPKSFAAELECAILNTYQARWQIAADTVGLGFAQGKTMLWHRDLLDRAGGIRALAAEPAEDAAATKVVRNAGLNVRLFPGPFLQPLGPRELRSVWDRQLRWARLRRACFKPYFIPEIVSGGFVPMCAAIFLLAADAISFAALVAIASVWYAAEVLLAMWARWHWSSTTVLAIIARDLLIPPLWIAAWAGNNFTWRGNAMHIGEDDDDDAGFVDRVRGVLRDYQSLPSRRMLAAALARRWRALRSRSSG